MGQQNESEPRATRAASSAGKLRSVVLALSLSGFALLGCSSRGSTTSDGSGECVTQEPGLGCVEASVAQCFQRKPGVGAGVYGCVTSTDDVGPPKPAQAFAGFRLDVFDTQPPATPDDGLVPAAQVTTDAMGFFEFELTPGAHWLCTSFRRCVSVDVADGATRAFNYDFGVGPGW